MIRVVTALYGGRDRIWPQARQDRDDVQWVAITDDLRLPVPEPWHFWYCPRVHHEHPNMQAKFFKTHPPFGPGVDAVIWQDASWEVTSPRYVDDALRSAHDGLAAWRHPRRTTIATEVEASIGSESQGGRYAALPLREQLAHYQEAGYPDAGLYACGTVVYADRAVAEKVGKAWWDECNEWGYQDQVSFPYVCWRAGVTPGVFPVPQLQRRTREGGFSNQWAVLHPHERET